MDVHETLVLAGRDPKIGLQLNVQDLPQPLNAEEELKRDLFNKETAMEEVFLKLDRANLILGDWLDEYGFISAPNPKKASRWGETLKGDEGHDEEGEQS